MTYDELLAKVSNYKDAGLGSLVALRAVVELHKPEHSIRGYRCTFDDELFPCKHHQAIEKELG
jgi:hypothetical protein